MSDNLQLVTIKEASEWATDFLRKEISESNISYLVAYGKVKKHNGGSTTRVDLDELKNYYGTFLKARETSWKQQLGNDLNWTLSFDQLKESDTTKHVHRLHPYKGKFIPQLVEYFLDAHTDNFKKNIYFKKGDIVLDPFAGSGTTLVQANEMDIHSIGIDISQFNCMITETKMLKYDNELLGEEIENIKKTIRNYEVDNNISQFEKELLKKLAEFNNTNFPSPSYKYDLTNRKINEKEYSNQKEEEFLKSYYDLIKKHNIKLRQEKATSFLDKWYIENVREEINFLFEQIKKVKNKDNKKILAVILSRTIRSCRATTHSDLATLKEPQISTYYCFKHKKICKPIFSVRGWFDRYLEDTVDRIKTFDTLRTNSHRAVIPGDSRTVDIFEKIKIANKSFHDLLKKQKVKGIFSSPPYVGQIDYHEQHAYAYDLFNFERNDQSEIGPLYKGQGLEARNSYVDGISKVLINCKKYLADDFDVFLVANDKYNLYPTIARNVGMKIVDQFRRPVLNRTERDKSPYSEIIFHLKNNEQNTSKIERKNTLPD